MQVASLSDFIFLMHNLKTIQTIRRFIFLFVYYNLIIPAFFIFGANIRPL